MSHKSNRPLYQILILSLVLTLGACHIKVRGDGFRSSANDFDSRSSNRAHNSETVSGQDIHKVNGSVIVASGTSANDVSTVNGRVLLERGSTARSVSTVNGRVEISGAGVIAKSVDTVNGRISATRGGEIGGSARTVNGRINLSNVAVGGNIGTSNGNIDLFDVSVGDSIETRNGDVRLENSIVEQDLLIRSRRKTSLFWIFDFPDRDPEIIIGPGSEIKGDLIVTL